MGNARNIAFWVVLLVLVVALFSQFNSASSFSTPPVAYSDFVKRVDAGDVTSVTLDGEKITVTPKDGAKYIVIRPSGEQVTDLLLSKGLACARIRRSNPA